MRSLLVLLVALFVLVGDASAQRGRWSHKPQRQQRNQQGYQQDQGWTVVNSPVVTPVVPAAPATATTPAAPAAPAVTVVDDALAEVNAERARRGLRAFLPDPLLNKAALACAKQRASRHIHGHLPESDFTYLHQVGGNASSAGCGALEPSWGWGTCCTYDNYTYCGAAWVMGDDGRRYMHVFVR